MFNEATLAAAREAAEKKKKLKAERRRLRPIAEANRKDGEEYKVLARPFERLRTIDRSFTTGTPYNFQVTVRAIDEDGSPVDMTRIWATINGKNVNYRRPSKGIGEYGDFGPYVIDFTNPGGYAKLKVQVGIDTPAVIFFRAKDINYDDRDGST